VFFSTVQLAHSVAEYKVGDGRNSAASPNGLLQKPLIERSFQIRRERMEELFTVSEVAEQLEVNEVTVRRWIYNGIIEAQTLPSQGKKNYYRIKQSVVQEIKKRNKYHRYSVGTREGKS